MLMQRMEFLVFIADFMLLRWHEICDKHHEFLSCVSQIYGEIWYECGQFQPFEYTPVAQWQLHLCAVDSFSKDILGCHHK